LTTQWRFRHEGRTLGPYPWPLLLQLHHRGSLQPQTPVQETASGRWMTLDQALQIQAAPPVPAAPVPPQPSPAAPAPPPAPLRNYWLLLWYVVPLLALMVAFYWVIFSVRDDIDPRPRWLLLTGITVALLLYYLIGSLWLWLSSRGHHTGSQVLRLGAVVILGMLLVALLAANIRPLRALLAMAIEPDPYGQFAIGYEQDGRTLVYTGALGYGAPAVLLEQLRAHPAVDTVVLDSAGGWMVAGRGLARVLRERHIGTVVAREHCDSACTLPFESAPTRILEGDATLGFHSESNQFSWARSEHANDSFVETFAARGIPQAFIDHAIQTPSNRLWRPDVAQLFRAHAIDRMRFDGRDMDESEYFLALVDQYLADPEFAALERGLQEFAPAHLQKLRRDVAQLLEQDVPGAQIGATTMRTIEDDERLALERAGDAAQLERAGLLVDLLDDFRTRAPELCYAVWTGEGEPAVGQGFTREERGAYLQLMGDMLASAAESPRPPPSDEDGAALIARAVYPAYLKYGKVVYDVPAARREGRIDDARVCEIARLTFHQIQTMRPSEGGAVMRWLAHGKTPGGE
jgi:hypothetical protein